MLARAFYYYFFHNIPGSFRQVVSIFAGCCENIADGIERPVIKINSGISTGRPLAARSLGLIEFFIGGMNKLV